MAAPAGIVLAGGRATRMGGGDKPLLRLGRGTLLDHVIARFAPQVDRLALSANGDPARFAGLGIPVLPDPVAGFPGPLAGLLAGLIWAEGAGADRVVTAAADTPFLPCDLVPRLILAAEDTGAPVVLAASGDRRHPTFGLWPVALRPAVETALAAGRRRVDEVATALGATTARFPAAGIDPFFNVNRPQDLAAAEAML